MAEPSFTLKNRYILGLGNWLMSLSLYGRESRERTKFVEILSEQLKETEAMRVEILKKYADKDETGELKLIEKDGQKNYHIADELLPEFNKEMNQYLDETFTVEGSGNSERLKKIKFIILDTNEKIDSKIAAEYSVWADAAELIES